MNEQPSENFSRGMSGGLSGYSRTRGDRDRFEGDFGSGNLIILN
jgi:hypothetical protein